MAWSDKPTNGQIGALLQEYEPYLLEELEYAKATGARTKADAIRDLLQEDILRQGVLSMASKFNRGYFSKLIERAEQEYYVDPNVQIKVDSWLKEIYNVELDYERVRRKWAEERERCLVN